MQEQKQIELLRSEKIDLVILARYHQILTKQFVESFPRQIINIHHSFLPAFAGSNPYLQAYQKGVKVIGATSHYVTEGLDEGPIIAQSSFNIGPGMGLKEIMARGQRAEAATLVKAVKLYLGKHLDVYWGVVREV